MVNSVNCWPRSKCDKAAHRRGKASFPLGQYLFMGERANARNRLKTHRFARALSCQQTTYRKENVITEAMSDYYVKGTTKAGEPVTLPIEDDNVFTHCPRCGKEHAVDIVELASSGDFDLYGSAVYCRDCTAGREPREE